MDVEKCIYIYISFYQIEQFKKERDMLNYDESKDYPFNYFFDKAEHENMKGDSTDDSDEEFSDEEFSDDELNECNESVLEDENAEEAERQRKDEEENEVGKVDIEEKHSCKDGEEVTKETSNE